MAGIVIDDSPNTFLLTIEAIDRALWLNGEELYYSMPKDYRPDINPYDLEDAMQAYYKLYNLAKDSYQLNKVPTELVKSLENLKRLAQLLQDYSFHILGTMCEPKYFMNPQATKDEEK